MNSPKFVTVVAIAALLIALAAIVFTLKTKRQVLQPPKTGNSEPNRPAVEDRVQNAEERARMEQYVAVLQSEKKVIKSFPGPSGETIDCVDVYNQPALKREGMEGHVIQFAPTTQPPEARAENLSRDQKLQVPNQLFTLTGQTCPDKSAPMARLTMDTLKHFRTLDEYFQKNIEIERPTGSSSGPPHQWAQAARSVDNWGAESIFNVWSPFVEQSNEFSLSQMWVVRGSGDDKETVEAGWQVYRDRYGDWRAHLFIYFTPDNYKKNGGGCYDLSCKGFVQVNNSVYIGGGFANYSSEGAGQWEFKLLWYKDGIEGAWWLKYGDTWVGYYPRTLFDAKGLRDNSDRVDFGGEIVNRKTDNRHTHTDMGSGNWPYQGYGWAAYQRGLRYVDTSNVYQRATDLNRIVTNDRCYDLSLFSDDGSWEVYFYFGGSGFNSQCP